MILIVDQLYRGLRALTKLQLKHVAILNSVFWAVWTMFTQPFGATPVFNSFVVLLSFVMADEQYQEFVVCLFLMLGVLMQLRGEQQCSVSNQVHGLLLGFIIFSIQFGSIMIHTARSPHLPVYFALSFLYFIATIQVIEEDSCKNV